MPGARILVVEDNEKNMKLFRDVLRAKGYRTLEATTGARAVELAAAHRPGLVLMDLRLPDMDGTDAAQALASEPLTAQIPVVALSALRLEGELPPAFAGHIEKPIDIQEFPHQVRQYRSG